MIPSSVFHSMRGRSAAALVASGWLAGVFAVMIAGLSPAQAQAPGTVNPAALAPTIRDTKPYDDRLLRLGEILGAIHFLRELCGGNDGPLWRERMEELVRAEGPSALRQAKLTRSFNQGYRNYQRTYSTCTPTAQTTITRFVAEGQQISETLLRTIP